jgi:ABC-type branched-subunit amino acid transport system ATPase component/ABC-type branched-subunit amino acid transport system permease subunit
MNTAALTRLVGGSRGKQLLAAAAGILAFIIVASFVLPLLSTPGGKDWETPFPFVLLGIIVGSTYGLLGVGLVMIFRSNRIINFAHGEMGAFGASLFALAVVKWHVPYWVALPLALVASGGTGALVETAVVRRLRNAPRLMSVVATLGVGQFLVLFASVINNEARAASLFPDPPGMFTFNVGPLFVGRAYTAMLVLSPIVVIALAIFLKRSRFGLGILGAAANPEGARLAGISAARMSSLAWALAGGLSAFTAILTQPTQGFSSAGFFGPSLLLRALACAVIARMSSLPIALAAGMGLGVIEQLVQFNYGQGSLMNPVLFVVILLALLVQRPRSGREEEKGSWAAVQAMRPIPDHLRGLWIARNLGRLTAGVALVVAIIVPLFLSSAGAITLTGMVGFTIVGLSVGIATGLGGQLTLGQFAIAGIGAVASMVVARSSGNFLLAFAYAGAAGALASLVIGLPALRIKGLLLTVTTLAFALMVPGWLLGQSWMLGTTFEVPKVVFFGNELESARPYYFFALGLLLLTMWLARNVWGGGLGRVLRAIRDNEDNARAFTVPGTLTKVQGFLLSGFIAGVGGAVYAHGLTALNAASFATAANINVVMMTVVGGISLMPGPLLGVLLVVGLPNLALADSLALAGTQLGILMLILYLPGGLASLVEPIRDRLLNFFARRAGIPTEQPEEDLTAEATSSAPAPEISDHSIRPLLPVTRLVAGETLLRTTDLRKSFGGVHAVDGVSLDVRAGEILGVIGPNGAGKTTTFELIGGFTRPDTGEVWFDGRDITWTKPEDRARLGLIRSFQDAALFPTMTVVEIVQLAMERVWPTRVLPSVLGLRGLERDKEERARQIISFMGLERFWSKQVRELSTGTRRITELACLVALEPTLLLLDEPSSGIAQRETEQLGRVLSELKERFNMTLLIIEHDIPLIMGLSDRIVAMADGRVIADGTPDQVREEPAVVESYLGGSLTAIERSGERTEALTPAGQGAS